MLEEIEKVSKDAYDEFLSNNLVSIKSKDEIKTSSDKPIPIQVFPISVLRSLSR